MRIGLMFVVALLASACSAAGMEEPPTQLRITLDGKQLVTHAGAETEVEVGGRSVKLRVEELPWRHFSTNGLQFDYPRHFPWEFDPEPPRSWTLDGNSAVIMLFDNTIQERAAEDLAADIEKALSSASSARRTKTELRTAKSGTLAGVASTITLARNVVRNEVFVLGKGGASWLLVLQDSLADDGSHSTEYAAMRARLAATLEF
ncbi:MAG: hypothetical protein K8F35_01220 [Dokdonella sp.]|uniref:hypothetical protein n=1 Tax=Dokdonella sp. TaxID=2291710 RepID=UPI0025BCCC5A|nr:hypothetical protein [Dokdonella sp.]MBZ0221626.1 hypothetical protein [Dokdonella sp.]